MRLSAQSHLSEKPVIVQATSLTRSDFSIPPMLSRMEARSIYGLLGVTKSLCMIAGSVVGALQV